MSSIHGRRCERLSRREVERRERNVRKAWGWGWVACWLVTGSVAGEDIGVGGVGERLRECGKWKL